MPKIGLHKHEYGAGFSESDLAVLNRYENQFVLIDATAGRVSGLHTFSIGFSAQYLLKYHNISNICDYMVIGAMMLDTKAREWCLTRNSEGYPQVYISTDGSLTVVVFNSLYTVENVPARILLMKK